VGSYIRIAHHVCVELLDAMRASLFAIHEHPQLTALPLRTRRCTIVNVQGTTTSTRDERPDEAVVEIVDHSITDGMVVQLPPFERSLRLGGVSRLHVQDDVNALATLVERVVAALLRQLFVEVFAHSGVGRRQRAREVAQDVHLVVQAHLVEHVRRGVRVHADALFDVVCG
jgi:hypothetical protein